MPPLSEATRPLMWNISQVWVMYGLSVIALAIFAWGLYRRINFWRQGKDDRERLSDWGKRLVVLLREVFLQKQVRNSRYPAVMHCLVFYSFLVLFVTTLIVMVDYDAEQLLGLELNIFQGFVYVFFSVASELAGLLVLAGIAMAAWRRYVIKPDTLLNTREDGLVLLLIAGMVVTGYAVEGLRIAVIGDQWKILSPVGWGVSSLLTGMSEEAGKTAHASLWWVHTVFAMGWIALIPYTKFVHLLSLPTNVFFSKLKPRGEFQRPDIEKLMESDDADLQIGIQKPDELTWKQRLDLDTCISCGRCEEVCPSFMSDKDSLTPRQLISRLKTALKEAGAGTNGNGQGSRDIVGGVFDEEYVWHCRTCSACMEVCPALIDHIDTLMELRRNEVLIQGRLPEEAERALRIYETNGNPFGPQSERTEWISRMNVKVVAPGEKVDVLYWIGCCVTFDPQKHRIAEDLCRLMEKCGIDFGVRGGARGTARHDEARWRLQALRLPAPRRGLALGATRGSAQAGRHAREGRERLGAVPDNALQTAIRGIGEGLVDLVNGRLLLQVGNEIHERYRRSRYADRDAMELALEFRDDHADHLGGAGGGGSVAILVVPLQGDLVSRQHVLGSDHLGDELPVPRHPSSFRRCSSAWAAHSICSPPAVMRLQMARFGAYVGSLPQEAATAATQTSQ